MQEERVIDYDEWYDEYMPIEDSDGIIYFAREDIPEIAKKKGLGIFNVWTYISEEGEDYIVSGAGIVNAVDYIVTRKKYNPKQVSKIIIPLN